MYLTRNQIARLAGISYNIIYHYLRLYPLKTVEAPNMRKTQKYYLRSDVEAWIEKLPIDSLTRTGIANMCGHTYRTITRWLEKYPLEPIPNRNKKTKFYRLADVELWLQQLTTEHNVNLAKSKPNSD